MPHFHQAVHTVCPLNVLNQNTRAMMMIELRRLKDLVEVSRTCGLEICLEYLNVNIEADESGKVKQRLGVSVKNGRFGFPEER